ncbi:MAG: patatin family protein [Spirochaetales bacterium]|nr:patatin family protein [Spirochaetales bacterium]
MSNKHKIGLVDMGGGMRGIYGAGVLDYCMEQDILFDYCVGVSAGSANITSYLAGQHGRNYKFYTEYAFRKEYMSVGNLIKKHNYVNLEYIYGILSNSDGEYPLDYNAMMSCRSVFRIVAMNALTGEPYYFDKSDMHQDDYGAIKASSCVPAVNLPYIIEDIPYFDGGMTDPLPFERCFAAGCDRVVLILTRPKTYRRKPDRDRVIAGLLQHSYPQAADRMRHRADIYNLQLETALRLERAGRLLIVAPDNIGKMKTLTKDKQTVIGLYHKGKSDAEVIKQFVNV